MITNSPPAAEIHRAIAQKALLSDPRFKGIEPEALKAVWPAIMTAARIIALSHQRNPPIRPMIVFPDLREEVALIP
jgi:hypothetical protein